VAYVDEEMNQSAVMADAQKERPEGRHPLYIRSIDANHLVADGNWAST
jgi:hypothetical protein